MLTSLIFAANHAVQGLSGVIQTFIGLVRAPCDLHRLAANLLLLILIHGAWDTFSVTIMYFGLRW